MSIFSLFHFFASMKIVASIRVYLCVAYISCLPLTLVAAGFPVFFLFVFSCRFLDPYKSSFVKLLDMSFFWSDSPELTATFLSLIHI